MGGAQAGYNWQWNDNFVFGIEADIQASALDARISANISDPVTGGIDLGTKLNWFGTLRPRLGYAQDNLLMYVTGGAAYGDVTTSIGMSGGGTGFTEEFNEGSWGYAVGAGLEYALSESISFKSEYLYTDLGARDILRASSGGDSLVIQNQMAFHTVRAGLNFHF